MKGIQSILLLVIELILLIAVLAGVTPSVLQQLTGIASNLTAGGVPMGSLLAPSQLGGILWFALCLLIVAGVIFLAIRGARGKGY